MDGKGGGLVDPNHERMVGVKGLPRCADWQEVKDFMKVVGEVQHVEVLYDDWGGSKCVAFVRYAKNEEAQAARDTLNGTMMQGKVGTNTVAVTEWKGAPPEGAQVRGFKGKSSKGKGKSSGNPMQDMMMQMMGFGGGGGWGGDSWGPYGGKGKGKWGKTPKEPVLVDPSLIPIINRVKDYQKASKENKESWYSFCGDIKDPARHKEEFLQEFIDKHGVP